MNIYRCLPMTVLLVACSSGAHNPPEKEMGIPPEILSGEANIPIGTATTAFAWFVGRQSLQCNETSDYQSSFDLFISDWDGCGALTYAPCAKLKNISLLAISVDNRGLANNPIKAREYALDKKPLSTGHNEYAVDVGALFFDKDGKRKEESAVDEDGNFTWSGSFTLDDVSDNLVTGSLDLLSPSDVSYEGSFTALKCDELQKHEGPLCFGETVEADPACP